MKYWNKKTVVLAGIAICIVLYILPIMRKRFFPYCYRQGQVNAIKPRILRLEQRVTQQKYKIELKQNELRQYLHEHSNDPDFLDKVMAKKNLIKILESIQAKTLSALDKQRRDFAMAQDELK